MQIRLRVGAKPNKCFIMMVKGLTPTACLNEK